MTAAVVGLALVLALLGVLVIGLLRSHAEILQALHELGIRLDGSDDTAVRTPSAAPAVGPRVAPPIRGTRPDGSAITVDVDGADRPTLVAFLTSGCLTCQHFWQTFGEPGFAPPAGLVIVTGGPDRESPAQIAELAPAGFDTVLSTDAWEAYDVPVSPYFVVVEAGTGAIAGEGASARWTDVVEQLLATVDTGPEAGMRAGATGRRDRQVDRSLRAAGIHPGDPSLHHE
jgi:hypothetical protein